MEICSLELCCGCGQCAYICPRSAIEMVKDSEGFLRPAVDEKKCISCGLCEKKCPVNKIYKATPSTAYAAYSKDKEIRNSSSSGGVFSVLALKVLSEGGAVVGAGFDESLNVIHKTVTDKDGLCALRGSKYVQSDATHIYEQIKDCLSNGKTVMFSGTPCQCAAVKNVFGDREQLILCDFICHGVPTPALWKKYIDEEMPNAKAASFRDKKLGWEEFSMRVETEDRVYSASQYKDPYLRMFLQNIALRPSCYQCSWKCENYSSDLTLADFWGISKVYPHMNDDKGTSAVVIRSQKGESLFDSVKDELVFEQTKTETVSNINTAFSHSALRPEKRTEFFSDLGNNKSFKELSDKYVRPLPEKEIIKIRAKRVVKKLMCKVYSIKNRCGG